MANRILVVWYSRGGTTAKVASHLARALGADLDPIEENASRAGIAGYMRSALEAVVRGLPAIRTRKDAKEYDLVVVGTPVWAGTMSSPVRTYLYTHRGDFRNAAFFAVMGGRGGEAAVNEMRLASGLLNAPTNVLTQRDVDQGRHVAECDDFIKAIQASLSLGPRTPDALPAMPLDLRARPLET